ncbi:MAG: type II toxin-antitoxin system RelB/DinJ family antitoxin [Burkholderiales bacterium]|jgi:DNA-damage-inducible protein J|nr:type II toxin-antitoxin system RelB/DinJ family antitoxin [Burkholderiales bacterium]
MSTVTTRQGKKSLNKVVHFRIDGKTKQEAENVLQLMGLTVASASRLMLIRVAQEQKLPFSPLVPNKETVEALTEIRDGQYADAKAFPDGESLLRDIEEA